MMKEKAILNIIFHKICLLCVVIMGFMAIVGTSDENETSSSNGGAPISSNSGVPVSEDSLVGTYTLTGFTYTFYDENGEEIEVITEHDVTDNDFRGTMIVNPDNSVTQTIYIETSTQINTFSIQGYNGNSVDILEDGCIYEIKLYINGSELTIIKPYDQCDRISEEIEEWTKES